MFSRLSRLPPETIERIWSWSLLYPFMTSLFLGDLEQVFRSPGFEKQVKSHTFKLRNFHVIASLMDLRDCFLSPWNSVAMHSSSLDDTCLPMLLDGSVKTHLLRDMKLKQRNNIELAFTGSSKAPCAQGSRVTAYCSLPWGLRAFHSFGCRISNILFMHHGLWETKDVLLLSHVLKLLTWSDKGRH